MKTYSLFDVMGPVMVGPSSSHTAGACRIARVAKKISGKDFTKVIFNLHGSFAETYLGHGTDKALVAGALGIAVDDERLRNSFEIAKEKGIDFSFKRVDLGPAAHPNSVKIEMFYPDGRTSYVIGASIGGGNIEINNVDGIEMAYGNNYPTFIFKYKEQKGVIAFVSSILSENGYNIEKMATQKENDTVTLIVEMTEEVEKSIVDEIVNDGRFNVSKYLGRGY